MVLGQDHFSFSSNVCSGIELLTVEANLIIQKLVYWKYFQLLNILRMEFVKVCMNCDLS